MKNSEMKIIETDCLVIGGGIFGCHAAVTLAENSNVILVEKDKELFTQASLYNQTRIHTGAHYPRAPFTAFSARKNLLRFEKDFANAVNKQFTHSYAIARDNSFTDSINFEKFLNWLEIRFERYDDGDIFNSGRISSAFRIQENSFDPNVIRKNYETKLSENNVKIMLTTEVISGSKQMDGYHTLVKVGGIVYKIISQKVINATYSKLNQVNELYGTPLLPLRNEKARLIFLKIPNWDSKAVTIMDGPFLSLTPYGLSGLHVLTSVTYTHQKISEVDENLQYNLNNSKEYNLTNDKLILNQLKNFLPNIGSYYHHGSKTIVKTTLKSDDNRDERPTVVYKFEDFPGYYSILAGKVSSIYEVEEFFANEGE